MSPLMERDDALALVLEEVPVHGWTDRALRAALTRAGADPIDGEILFPGGPLEMVEAFIARANTAMTAGAEGLDLPSMRTTARVRALIALRFRLLHPHKEAVRRALAVLACPGRAHIAARSTAVTVDTIWHLAGDTSADFNWYTKRALLAGAYTSTLLFWLADSSEDDAATLAFLDRRLAGVGQIGKLRGRIETALGRFRPAA